MTVSFAPGTFVPVARIALIALIALALAATGCSRGDEAADQAPAAQTAATGGAAAEEATEGPRRGRVLLRDDFSSGDSGRWLVNSTSTVGFGYAKDRYRIRVKRARGKRVEYTTTMFERPVAAVRVRVEAAVPRGSGFAVAGIVCVAKANGVGYFFGVAPRERYYSIEKVTRSEFNVRREGRGRGSVRGGKRTNRITGDCIGGGKRKATRVSLRLNGKVIASYRDRNGFDGFRGVGLAVFSERGRTDVLFDNLVARER